jgi:hypothetical protein
VLLLLLLLERLFFAVQAWEAANSSGRWASTGCCGAPSVPMQSFYNKALPQHASEQLAASTAAAACRAFFKRLSTLPAH